MALKLITYKGFPPFSDQRIHKEGMLTHIIGDVFDEMNQDVSINFLSKKQTKKEIEGDVFAGGFPFIKNEIREKDYYFSEILS